VYATYADSSLLKFGNFYIKSEEGIQQGDPLGPLEFCRVKALFHWTIIVIEIVIEIGTIIVQACFTQTIIVTEIPQACFTRTISITISITKIVQACFTTTINVIHGI